MSAPGSPETGRRRLILIVLALVALTIGMVALAPDPPGASTWSADGRGLLAAYRYLEEREHEVSRWERPLSELPEERGGVLVVATPLATAWTPEDTAALRRFSQRGGRVVLALDGTRIEPAAAALLRDLSLWTVDEDDEGPLWWQEWRAWRSEPLPRPRVADDAPGDLVGQRIFVGVKAPLHAESLWTDEAGVPIAFRIPRPPGDLVVLADRSALDNALLDQGANLAALEWLLAGRGPIRFDEYHQGHIEAARADLSDVVGPFERLLLHAGLLYLLWLWTTSRRFGPVLGRPGLSRSSVDGDLRALAALHRRAGHAAAAGRRLLALAHSHARRRGLHPDRGAHPLPEDFDGDESALLDLARDVAERQARRSI